MRGRSATRPGSALPAALGLAALAGLLASAACAARSAEEPPSGAARVASPPAGAASQTPTGGSAAVVTARPALHAHRPILIYDVTGGTQTGPIHTHLTVYSDGFAAISDASRSMLSPEAERGGDGKATYAFVGEEAAHELERSLAEAGAHEVPPAVGSPCLDTPRKSLTVFPACAGGEICAHTVRWACSEDASLRRVEEIVRQFIRERFPGF